MQNSFSLGLLHGALYGITPLTPWFIGLKRYVFEGQAKGTNTNDGVPPPWGGCRHPDSPRKTTPTATYKKAG